MRHLSLFFSKHILMHSLRTRLPGGLSLISRGLVLSTLIFRCSASVMNSLSNKAMPSFYRRPLPSTCTALSSKEGRSLFESALLHKGLKSFFPLMEQFTTQSEPAYCGISTLVIVLNALSVDPRRTWKGPWRWYTESMLNCCMDLEEVKQTGITMRTFACLAKCQGLNVTDNLASSVTLAEFRQSVRLACVEDSASPEDSTDDPFLVVSYHRKVLQQSGTGHFSPVAAFDEASDHVLILDTARFKYGAHWVPVPLLYEAMQPEDPDTGKSRGYFLLSSPEDENHPSMPVSILFRTRQVNHAAREKYKEFLQAQKKSPITWEQVVSYWTKDGSEPEYIWELTEVQLAPMEKSEQDAVESVRDLIESLIPPSQKFHGHTSRCRPNVSRTLCLSPQEILFVVYLASIDDKSRRDLVFNENSSASQATRKQLLAEAELLKLAIELATDLI